MFTLRKSSDFSLFGHGLYPAFFAPPHSTNHIYLLFTVDTGQTCHFLHDIFQSRPLLFLVIPKTFLDD